MVTKLDPSARTLMKPVDKLLRI